MDSFVNASALTEFEETAIHYITIFLYIFGIFVLFCCIKEIRNIWDSVKCIYSTLTCCCRSNYSRLNEDSGV